VLLRANERVYVQVNSVSIPCKVIYTVMPLRGRSGVFGG
jgi:hypothetical protein